MDNAVIQRVVERMEMLPSDLQQLVLEFVQTLQASRQRGVAGRQLLQFAGAISNDELGRMQQAIVAGCAQVDLNEW
jgi:hypothetical protein